MTTMGANLQLILESAHKGFAYELLALEIEIENQKDEKDQTLMENLSKLIQLYMLGVQVLQSNSDERYKFFNSKIQTLMKKKYIIEELYLASTGKKATKEVLHEVRKQERGIRKNDLDIQIFLNSEQCDIKRIKEIVKNQEQKIQVYQSRMRTTLQSQDQQIQERIKRRKMKSQCYSNRMFDLGSNPADVKERETMNEQIFGPQTVVRKNLAKGKEMRNGSIEKGKKNNILI